MHYVEQLYTQNIGNSPCGHPNEVAQRTGLLYVEYL